MSVNAVGRVDGDGMVGEVSRGQVQDGVGQFGVVLLAFVFEAADVVGDDHPQRFHPGEAFLEVFAVALDGGTEGPEVHAIGSNAHGATAATGTEGQDLAEAVEQAGPLLLTDEPIQLRLIGDELRRGQPQAEELQGLVLEGGVHRDGTDTRLGVCEQVHGVTSYDEAASRLADIDRSRGLLGTYRKMGRISLSLLRRRSGMMRHLRGGRNGGYTSFENQERESSTQTAEPGRNPRTTDSHAHHGGDV